jgi:hypothetical protein
LSVILFFGIFGLAKNSLAATGAPGSQGGIFYVEGMDGVVGWAQGASGEVIDVDIYIWPQSGSITQPSCSVGGMRATKTLTDNNNRFGSRNGKLFSYTSDCLKNLADGEYYLSVALGPNLFTSDSQFPFSVRAIDGIDGAKIWMHYLGVMVSRGSEIYDSYPTVMKDGNKYKMWYASYCIVDANNYGDAIFYAESDNGINWNKIIGPGYCNAESGGSGYVLRSMSNQCTSFSPTCSYTQCTCNDTSKPLGICPTGDSFSGDDMHTADPSVVKTGNNFYMYYTGASKQINNFGADNHIFKATSNDGINWNKLLGTDGKPKPVISPFAECTDPRNCLPGCPGMESGWWYGAGQSSVIYKDFNNDNQPEFIHYFSDYSNQTMAQSVSSSNNGIDFSVRQFGIMGDTTWDFKYSNYLSKFIGFDAIPDNSAGVSGDILFRYSNDGVTNWMIVGAISKSRTVLIPMNKLTSDQNHWAIHNGGLLGNPQGIIEGRNAIYYMGAGYGMQPYTNTWDIVGVDVWFSNSNDGQASAGDTNGDGHVNVFDFNILISNFGNQFCGNPADFNGNCQVDIFDYNILLNNFGK